MQVAIKPEIKETLIAVTNPVGRITWFADKAGIHRNTVTKLRKESEILADEEVMKKVESALKDKEVRQLIRELRQATA